MKILIVAATDLELNPILRSFSKLSRNKFEYGGHLLEVLQTGVGMMATSYHLGRTLHHHQYDLALNLGICGAFDRSIELSEVVLVESDVAIEEGAEDGEDWISLEDMGLRGKDEFPYSNGLLKASVPNQLKDALNYKKVKAISVNRVLGNSSSIQKMHSYYPAEIESMEGAAVFYSCSMAKVDCIQLRAVSNYVENRNKEEWQIEEALTNLADATLKLLENV